MGAVADGYDIHDPTIMNPPVATPFFFYLLAAIMIIGGILVITRKNAVHSAMALITTLLAQAALYLMLYAPFVAGVQIILYAGGIMVLFLFVIMLIKIERNMKERQFNKQWLVGIVAAAALGGLFIAVYTTTKGRRFSPKRRMAYRRSAKYAIDSKSAVRPQHGTIHVRLRDRLACCCWWRLSGRWSWRRRGFEVSMCRRARAIQPFARSRLSAD